MDRSASLSTRPLPSLDIEETLPRPRRAGSRARQIHCPFAWPRWPLTLAALCYALLALVLGAAVVATGASWHAVAPLAAPCALVACVAEWTARRVGRIWARDLAPAAYVAVVLLLPAPWAVLVAMLATLSALLARRGASTTAIATAAHAVLSVTLLAVAAHAALGDSSVLQAVVTLAAHPAALPRLFHTGPLVVVAPAATSWSGASLRAPGTVAALLLLCGGYYLFETVPPALACAVARRCHPLRAWLDLHGHTLPLQLAVLPLGPAVVAMYAAAPALTLLILPPAGATPWLAALLHRARVAAQEERELRDDTDARSTSATDIEEGGTRGDAWLEALLAAMRGMGGDDDLAEVTATLARAAIRLTPFRDCTVYLYEACEGVFVPHAEGLEGTRRSEVVSRARVEAQMSPRNRLGYSYYVPRPTYDEAANVAGPGVPWNRHGVWADGDAVLVPLLLKNGDVAGYMKLERPADGRVPTTTELTPLETLAFLAASVIARLRHSDAMLRLAASDGLTGLLNRRAFEEHLHRELSAATRRRRSLALMMIDIDDFGGVNNTYGHQVGDAALRLVAGVIRAQLRDSDAGARYGGDEFAVVLPELNAAGAADIAERLRAALAEETRRAAADGALPRIYTSIGVAAFPHHATDAAALVKAADDALYASKGLGKNRVSVK